MNTMVKVFQKIFTILTPFFLLATSIWLLLHPWIFDLEYNRAGFPEDPYGFSREERLKWSKVSLDYLLNSSDPSFLADLKFPDGSPLYNEREVSHMLDVKILVQKMITVWYLYIALLVVVGFVGWRTGYWKELLSSFYWGGWLTLILIASMILGVFLGFDALFTGFHRIFFSGDTWLFSYSDTLIRLFPMVFWRDAFIAAGGFTTLVGLCLILLLRKYRSY